MFKKNRSADAEGIKKRSAYKAPALLPAFCSCGLIMAAGCVDPNTPPTTGEIFNATLPGSFIGSERGYVQLNSEFVRDEHVLLNNGWPADLRAICYTTDGSDPTPSVSSGKASCSGANLYSGAAQIPCTNADREVDPQPVTKTMRVGYQWKAGTTVTPYSHTSTYDLSCAPAAEGLINFTVSGVGEITGGSTGTINIISGFATLDTNSGKFTYSAVVETTSIISVIATISNSEVIGTWAEELDGDDNLVGGTLTASPIGWVFEKVDGTYTNLDTGVPVIRDDDATQLLNPTSVVTSCVKTSTHILNACDFAPETGHWGFMEMVEPHDDTAHTDSASTVPTTNDIVFDLSDGGTTTMTLHIQVPPPVPGMTTVFTDTQFTFTKL